MNWTKLLSTKRTGQSGKMIEHHDRSQFQRDYDRLIFSSPFRRMQDKTQVFPLPGSIFVHNRLTHSLEVACVGRSLGNNVSRFLIEKLKIANPLIEELGSVTAAACLAHDFGNPPFGHSGEKAISLFFKNGEGKKYENLIPNQNIWNDFTNFEGNANAFRLLTHQFEGRRKGGFAMTYTTVASIVKYPYPSNINGAKKYGFFNSEKEKWTKIASELGISEKSGNPGVFNRHPIVFLVEAADDICYRIMDIEDAHKLSILSTEKTKELFLSFFNKNEDKERLKKIEKVCKQVTDINEQIAYLRAIIIGRLVDFCTNIFCDNHTAILEGDFEKPLINLLEGNTKEALQNCMNIGYSTIYKHQSVVEIEIAGFKIINSLLNEFINAVLNPKEHFSGLLLPFIPLQFKVSSDAPPHLKIQSVIDFISGMTDVYALDLFRKITGTGL
ncbi:MAG: dNTP triphosphohydrolase [Marinilabiliaceae bacterium]|nr:dNTP triphosphohydrolase [Marinilabiliaceae bacterium]